MSHSQQFRNRRCSCQIGFGVRIGLGNSFLFTWPLFSFCCLLDDACVCSCSSQASFRSLWMRLRSSRFSSTLADLLFDRLYLPVCGSCGRRRRLFALGFAFGCCVVNLWEGWFAEVSFRKVSSCNCACSRRGNGGGGGGQGRPCHSAVLSEPGVSEAPRYHARGVTQQGDVLGSLF